MTTTPPTSAASGRVILVMTVAVGVVIANLYYAQPLADALARAFTAPTSGVGAVLTVMPVAYAVGLATLVPLGDVVERRRLLVILLACAAAGQLAMAAAPSLVVFGAAAALVALASVAVQVVVPFAAHVAAAGHQGRAVATVMTGLFLGILLSRSVSGVVASAAGWQAVFVLGAVLTAGVGVLLWRELPALAPTTSLRYPALLASVVQLVRQEPVLRLRMLYGALTFSSFSAFWVSVGFLLARPPYGWSEAAIGAFALLGAAGAVAARFAGRVADRGRGVAATGAYLLLMVASFALLAAGETSVAALAAGVVLMDLGCQAVHITNQGQIYPLRPDARSRLNTAYMTSYFAGGAIGSAASTLVFPVWGWVGVCLVGAVFPALALGVWLAERVRARPASPATAGPAPAAT
ncbi:MAG: MFS transporter [Kineosporiaceae bacterium]